MNPFDQIKPQEVVANGSRPLKDRRLFKALGISAVLAVAAAATVGGMASKTSYADQSPLSTPEETVTAQVVAKVIQPQGHLLSKGYFKLGDNNVWQSPKDAPGAAMNLVLSIPGELSPVMVAVSPDIYSRYCKNPKFFDTDQTQLGGCGAIVNSVPAPTAAERNAPLDKIEISFTRSRVDGSLQVTQLGGYDQLKTDLVDLLQMRRDSKNHLEQSQAHKATAPAKPG